MSAQVTKKGRKNNKLLCTQLIIKGSVFFKVNNKTECTKNKRDMNFYSRMLLLSIYMLEIFVHDSVIAGQCPSSTENDHYLEEINATGHSFMLIDADDSQHTGISINDFGTGKFQDLDPKSVSMFKI